jgi:fluoroacetyl-CoA thioesterase
MKTMFKVGDEKFFKRIVTPEDFPLFPDGHVVHHVCSTYSIARDMEWTTRQFVLDMRDEDEEGIGTFVNVRHHHPAFEGDEILYRGVLKEVENSNIVCTVEAFAGGRRIASGETGQKILKKDKLNKLLKRS